MTTTLKRSLCWSLSIIAHAALTLALLLAYVNYSIRIDHGMALPTLAGTVSQYVKSAFLVPILLPLLRWHPDLVAGPLGYGFLLLNSTLWIWAGWWIWNHIPWRPGDAD